jgi:hypothetical protein
VSLDKSSARRDPDMLDDYDFSGGVRGKHAGLFREGARIFVNGRELDLTSLSDIDPQQAGALEEDPPSATTKT